MASSSCNTTTPLNESTGTDKDQEDDAEGEGEDEDEDEDEEKEDEDEGEDEDEDEDEGEDEVSLQDNDEGTLKDTNLSSEFSPIRSPTPLTWTHLHSPSSTLGPLPSRFRTTEATQHPCAVTSAPEPVRARSLSCSANDAGSLPCSHCYISFCPNPARFSTPTPLPSSFRGTAQPPCAIASAPDPVRSRSLARSFNNSFRPNPTDRYQCATTPKEGQRPDPQRVCVWSNDNGSQDPK
jgi:hypothetical protein